MESKDKSGDSLLWVEFSARFDYLCDVDLDAVSNTGDLYKVEIHKCADSRRFIVNIFHICGVLPRNLFLESEEPRMFEFSKLGFTSGDLVSTFEIGFNCWPNQKQLELLMAARFFTDVDTKTMYSVCSDFYWFNTGIGSIFQLPWEQAADFKKQLCNLRKKYFKCYLRHQKQFRDTATYVKPRADPNFDGDSAWF